MNDQDLHDKNLEQLWIEQQERLSEVLTGTSSWFDEQLNNFEKDFSNGTD
tara:strand:+ start:2532 stop:2681 length:150 start_codon:yes stop_codon:yes gene_type:complete